MSSVSLSPYVYVCVRGCVYSCSGKAQVSDGVVEWVGDFVCDDYVLSL